MNLEELRKEIDSIDTLILELFEKRMDICKKVAQYKIENNLEVFQSDREAQIIEKIRNNTKDKSLKDGSAALFTTIMDISKHLQRQELMQKSDPIHFSIIDSLDNAKTIGCQGIAGANSETAANMIFGKDKPINFYPTFDDVFKAVENSEIDYGIIPIQNSTAGSVTQSYDLMIKHNFYIVRSVCVEISHCLAVKNDIDISEISTVYSHPQALSQCSDFLTKHNLSTATYSNTATAAQLVLDSNENIGAICSVECAESLGLTILKTGISNCIPNNTEFICISKRFVALPDANNISIIIKIPNESGSLYRLLTKFFINGMNLTRIESRPIKDGSFDVMFYMNITCNMNDINTQSLIKDLKNNLEYFKLIGFYLS